MGPIIKPWSRWPSAMGVDDIDQTVDAVIATVFYPIFLTCRETPIIEVETDGLMSAIRRFDPNYQYPDDFRLIYDRIGAYHTRHGWVMSLRPQIAQEDTTVPVEMLVFEKVR